jgi:hypothetical protein
VLLYFNNKIKKEKLMKNLKKNLTLLAIMTTSIVLGFTQVQKDTQEKDFFVHSSSTFLSLIIIN